MFQTARGVRLRGSRSAALTATIVVKGVDLTGAAFRLEVRDRRDGGQLRAGLDTVASAAIEGVRVASVDIVDTVPVTTLGIRINETTMEAMPVTEPGEDSQIVWGLHITPAGGLKFQALDGPFIVEASAVA